VLYRNLRDGLTGEPRDLLIENGRVVAYESRIEGAGGVSEDLGGREVLPCFVDAHCHILPTGLDLQKLNLSGASSQEEVLDLVRARFDSHPDGWLLAVQYDQNRFPNGDHLTRAQLDAISSSRPILLRHSNGHAAVANSAALSASRIAEDAGDPAGGSFGRDESGRLNGVLFERALESVSAGIPAPSVEYMVEAILRAGEKMRELGIIAAADMMTGSFDLSSELEAYRLAAERGCRIATRLYVNWSSLFGRRAGSPEEVLERLEALSSAGGLGSRVVGVKIFADGAIASATAGIYGAYEGSTPEPVEARGVRRHGRNAHSAPARQVSGQLIYRPDRLRDMVRVAHDAGWPVAVHAIGDYAADVVMDAFAATDEPSRHRIEHAMILSDPQIARLASLGCAVCFQPEFLLRFGHAYRRQLGEARASRLKRTRSVLDAGIPLAFSSDRPVVPGDPLDGIRMAVDREGFDPSERCTWIEAVRAYTQTAAAICGDADVFGSLTPGAAGEFQIRD
jgi:predicted amidohydrolase YtcJ